MRKATLTSEPSTDEGTLGELVTDSGFKCVTGELPNRGDAHNVSCIAPTGGVFPVKREWSEKHQAYLFHVIDPTRGMIEIHTGNLCGDVSKGYASDVLGCILPGVSWGLFREGEKVGNHVLTRDQRGVTASRIALKVLTDDLGNEFELTIVRK